MKNHRDPAIEHLTRVSAGQWTNLASKRVWFGHQSVGGNIMQGVSDLIAEGAVPLPAPVDTVGALRNGIAHAANGTNMRPDTKVAAFSEAIAGMNGEVDVAFFKLCYVDIHHGSDIAPLVKAYREAIDGLSMRFPSVRFLHVTCPVTAVSPPWRAALKKIAGRPSRDFQDNAARESFSDALRAEYGSQGRVFDLAAIESTRPDGSRREFSLSGRRYPALVEEYTDDGRHLNAVGRRWVAAHLLTTLVAACASPR